MTSTPIRISRRATKCPSRLFHDIFSCGCANAASLARLTGDARKIRRPSDATAKKSQAERLSASLRRTFSPEDKRYVPSAIRMAIRSGSAEAIRAPISSGKAGVLSSAQRTMRLYSAAMRIIRFQRLLPALRDRRSLSISMRVPMSASFSSPRGSFSSRMAAISAASAPSPEADACTSMFAIRG